VAVDPVTCEPFSNDLQNTGVGSIVSVATVLVAFSAASTVALLFVYRSRSLGRGRSGKSGRGQLGLRRQRRNLKPPERAITKTEIAPHRPQPVLRVLAVARAACETTLSLRL
jgi:hypothetical protein